MLQTFVFNSMHYSQFHCNYLKKKNWWQDLLLAFHSEIADLIKQYSEVERLE